MENSSLTSSNADFWKRKLAAFLHDTPTKCLNIREHSLKSIEAMRRAGFTEDDIARYDPETKRSDRYDHEADWAAAAADRYPFPDSRASGLACAFDGHRNKFHHPLDGRHQLGFSPIQSDDLGTETEQVCQPLLETGESADPDFWRDRFFAHWRLWCRDAREKDHRLAFLPADTRLPDQLAHYADGSGNLTEGSLPYFRRQEFNPTQLDGMATFLASRRALSPSYHLQFSEALSAFALHCARPIVEAFDGRLIYAGGDDIVALLPADSALRCAEALRAAFQGSSRLPQLLAASPRPPEFTYTSPAPGFLTRNDSCDHHQRGTPIPFIVPGPAAEVSVGIAIAHFKAPLQDVVREAQTAQKRAKAPLAKNGLNRAAVSLRLMKRSGEILDWGSKWDGGGLELFHAIAHALDQKQLTGKFPHRLCEILAPFINETTAVTDLDGFPVAEVIRSEFARLLERHEDTKWDATSAAPLTTALEAYLPTLADRSASAAAHELTSLCTAVAFAHRTR